LPRAGCGTIFELSPSGSGSWGEKVLYAFQGFSDGAYPTAPVVFDRRGNLYGTNNCPQDCFYNYGGGVVFQLAPNSNGAWTESILYTFPMDSGCSPGNFGTGSLVVCSVAFDHLGNLYSIVVGGRTQDCTSDGCGAVFNLGQISVFNWYRITLYSFTDGSDGGYPQGQLNFDAGNNIYGTTGAGGTAGLGTAYRLTPDRGRQGWSETVLHSFQGGSSDGSNPTAGVVLDAAGNVYGTTLQGGSAGLGTVYMLTPQSNGTWTETVLYSFQGGSDASSPNSSLTFDAGGDLYSTSGGGAHGHGAVFKLTPSIGGHWTERVVYSFTGGQDGGAPSGGVVQDGAGNLYGTAQSGGTYGQNGGVAFEITP